AVLNTDALGGRRQAVDQTLRVYITIPENIREMSIDAEHGSFQSLQFQTVGRIAAALESIAVDKDGPRVRIVLRIYAASVVVIGGEIAGDDQVCGVISGDVIVEDLDLRIGVHHHARSRWNAGDGCALGGEIGEIVVDR